MKRIALLLGLPFLVGGGSGFDGVPVVEGRPDVVRLDRDGQPFRAAFNAARGKVRIVAYVAPTCGGCLRGLDRVQTQVLEAIAAPDLEVYVVWVKKNGGRERHVGRVTGLAPDPRATHYWDEHEFVLEALDRRLGLEGRACAGAFLLYDRDATWEGAEPPAAAYWSDAHAREFEQHGPEFDVTRFAREVQSLLNR